MERDVIKHGRFPRAMIRICLVLALALAGVALTPHAGAESCEGTIDRWCHSGPFGDMWCMYYVEDPLGGRTCVGGHETA